MKVFVALACLCVCAHASLLATPVVATAKLLSTGTSTSSRTQDAAGNYAFSYNEQHSTGGSSRSESGNGWGAQGSYSLNVGDGRQRVVKYVADGTGFRAAISTNEPGTAAQPAADTSIASPYLPPQAPPVPVVAAPAPVAVAAPAPLAVAAPAPLALPALAPAPIAAAPILSGWGAPAVAVAAPIVKAVAAIPAVSSYSTQIDHVAPAKAIAVAAPALPAPIVQAPLSGWN